MKDQEKDPDLIVLDPEEDPTVPDLATEDQEAPTKIEEKDQTVQENMMIDAAHQKEWKKI